MRLRVVVLFARLLLLLLLLLPPLQLPGSVRLGPTHPPEPTRTVDARTDENHTPAPILRDFRKPA
jgi:hypothetical protein